MRASAAANGWAAHGWATDGLGALKRQIAAIEGRRRPARTCALPLGIAGIDAALGGGLGLGATHEIAPAGPLHRGATFAFALGLACRARNHGRAERGGVDRDPVRGRRDRQALWRRPRELWACAPRSARRARAAPIDALWAMEEALLCRGVAAVIAEVTEELALTATRRLSLAVRHGGGLGLLVRHRALAAAARRSRAGRSPRPAARPTPMAASGYGLRLSLTKNRHGRCGRWTILWDHHERVFVDPALSVGVAQAAFDRPDRAPAAPGAYAPDEALVVAAPIKSALRLTAVNAVASALGLKPGMALADARAMHPRLKAVDADPLADRQFLEADRRLVRPLHAAGRARSPDGLILDISGCAHLFGGEVRLPRSDSCALGSRCGFRRAAVADTVGCAWAMAHSGDAGRAFPPGGARQLAHAPPPVAALRLAPDTVALLGEVGLKRVGDLLDRPRAALAARFGAELIVRASTRRWASTTSRSRRAGPCRLYVAEQRFADPIALERDVLGTIGRLGQRASARSGRSGEGARLLEIALFRVDGKVLRLSAATSRDARRLVMRACSPIASPRSATSSIPASAST